MFIYSSFNKFVVEFLHNFSASKTSEHIVIESELSISLRSIVVDVHIERDALLQQPNSSLGPDDIPGIFYWKLANVLVLPLSIIYQQSLYQCFLLDRWKLANIMPLYKGKGD